MNIQRILLATDFSASGAGAVEHAVVMAKKFGAALHVIHVLEYEIPIMADGLTYLPSNYFEGFEAHAAKQIADVITPEECRELTVTSNILRGVPFLEIIRYAREQKIDLIVMGTHGRGALSHVLMGNVAEKVVRKAPCPVLTVRDPSHEFVMP